MICKIGITADIKRQKAFWDWKCKNLQCWEITDGPFANREQAVLKETELRKKFAMLVKSDEFEPDSESNQWWVYSFVSP
jgi:hypothetical protein